MDLLYGSLNCYQGLYVQGQGLSFQGQGFFKAKDTKLFQGQLQEQAIILIATIVTK